MEGSSNGLVQICCHKNSGLVFNVEACSHSLSIFQYHWLYEPKKLSRICLEGRISHEMFINAISKMRHYSGKLTTPSAFSWRFLINSNFERTNLSWCKYLLYYFPNPYLFFKFFLQKWTSLLSKMSTDEDFFLNGTGKKSIYQQPSTGEKHVLFYPTSSSVHSLRSEVNRGKQESTDSLAKVRSWLIYYL